MPNAAARAYQAIRNGILDGSFPPGMQLREEMLAAEIGVSRTPIRDALRRLLADGLVTSERNYGTFVTNLDAEEVMQEFELRAILESHAAGRAATRITPEQIAELERLAAAMEGLDSAVEDDRERFARINTEFHMVIARAAQSRRLETMLAQLFQLPLVLLKQHRLQGWVNIERSNRQHMELIEAMKEGNAEWVAALMKAHLLSTRPTGVVPK